MNRQDEIISASEIGAWCYCHKAGHLQRLGHISSLSKERVAGNRYHQDHYQSLRSARRQRIVARIVVIACIGLLVASWIASLWAPR